MGLLRTGPGRSRLGYTPGSFLTRLVGSTVVSSSWPRTRSRRRSTLQRALQDRFRAIVDTVARLSPIETNALHDALREHNRRHTGLQGTATIRPEDLEHARLSGRLWAFLLPGGQLSIHVDALYDVSSYLDWLEPKVGSMVVRTKDGWRACDVCEPGAIFTCTPEGYIASCCQPAKIWPPSEVPPP